MPEFPSILLPATTVNNFARSLASALRRKGWSPKDIQEANLEQVCTFACNNPDLRSEAHKITQGLPVFLLYEQALPIIQTEKAKEPILHLPSTTAELVH